MLPVFNSLPSNFVPDILVVDDTPNNLRFLQNIFNNYDYKVRVALNGKLALKSVNFNKPDLILLDIKMPEMNGYQVCRALKEQTETADIPVIFISALDEGIDKVKAFEAGGVDYINKPLNEYEVMVRVNHQILLNQQQKQLLVQNEQLSKAYKQLQLTQSQLLQQEKMASLGQLVAGVAHEINNPVNFIYGNIIPARSYTNDLLQLVSLYQKHYPTPHAEIQEQIELIELEFIQEDFSRLLQSMEEGATRIKKIVNSLQKFCRVDKTNNQQADLHQGIESTLLLLQHRLKKQQKRAEIQVIKEFADLPLVKCNLEEINQVFMNLLSNALDALEEKMSQQSDFIPQLRITTQVQTIAEQEFTHKVMIRVVDNGVGIPAAIQDSLFNPFFTTKSVGKGIGLGLAVAYSIVVKNHDGRFYFNSSVSEGTEFVIELPV